MQFQDPDFEGGANVISLRQAQQNFVKYGACDEESLKFVRSPNKFDIKDSQWKPL
ncbi:Hydrolase (HAD superfamily) (plasmid) [Priestia megaterium]|nr:Hydrolase (HAD superfamily) [Priestia megaterium]